MASEMKVLHANFSFTQGGIDNMMNDIMLAQYNTGIEVYLLIVNDQLNKDVTNLIPNGIKTFFVHRPVGSNNLYYLLKIIFLILFVIRPDVIHCHNRNLGKICHIIQCVMRCKSLLTVHDMSYDTTYYQYFDYIVAISKSVKDDIYRTYHHNNVRVVYNGVDFDKILQRNNMKKSTPFRIVIVSRLDVEKKGHDILLRAVSFLKNDGIDLHLDIVGDGKGLVEIQELIDKLDLWDYVSILGSKSREWVYHHLCNYDLLVQPSRYEGFGLTIVEAIAAHVPVLVSDIDGPKEITCNGTYGWIFSAGNDRNLADLIRKIMSLNIEELHKKTNNDFLYMRDHFSIQTTVNNYIKLYQC